MKSIGRILLFASVSFTSASCIGMIYRKHVSPVQLGDATKQKTGRACVRSYLGLVTTGDASLHAALKQSGITRIASVDREYTNIIYHIVYRRYCVIVSGE